MLRPSLSGNPKSLVDENAGCPVCVGTIQEYLAVDSCAVWRSVCGSPVARHHQRVDVASLDLVANVDNNAGRVRLVFCHVLASVRSALVDSGSVTSSQGVQVHVAHTAGDVDAYGGFACVVGVCFGHCFCPLCVVVVTLKLTSTVRSVHGGTSHVPVGHPHRAQGC